MKKRNSAAEKSKDFLFEIGSEELPAVSLADLFGSPGENSLEVKFKKAFETHRIRVGKVRVWATPRRLIFFAEEVWPAQTPKEDLIKLLSKEEAYSPAGQPTEKLLMILKHRNFTLKEVVLSDLDGKAFVFIKKSEAVRKTAALLPEILEGFIRSLPFSKNMKWNDSGILFPRPIRNYLCFYGDQSIQFKLGLTRVKNETVIFSKSRRSRHVVKDIPAYFACLKKNGIIFDPTERKKAIEAVLEKLTTALQGKLAEDPFLLNEVNFLVENPEGLSAPFGDEFLTLPLEVLTVSMARKQRLFGLLDKEGRVLPRFLAILDGKVSDKEKKGISSNMENILHAKLQDSLFFYKEDIKISLEKKREELKNLVFLKNAGSMLDKSERLIKLAKEIGAELNLSSDDQKNLERACALSKSDLLTQMVGEFPELQGIMGKYYALQNGEPREVAEAIGEQYLPRTIQDKLPQSMPGAILAIFDKCDLVTACFGLGLDPTSSLDPYGIRRSATGIFKIILDEKINISIKKLYTLSDQLTHEAIANNHAKKNPNAEARVKKLEMFFKDRFKALLIDRGLREDLVEAAVVTRFDSPYETFTRAEALSKFSEERSFVEAWKIVERTSNILRSNKENLPERPNDGLFQEVLEKRVFEAYEKSHQAIREAASLRNFKLATGLYAEAFFDILNEFFEKVFVNAEDLTIRKNRLALLGAVNRLYTATIADLSKVRLAPRFLADLETQ